MKNDEFHTYQGQIHDETWEDRLVAVKNSIITEFRRQPVNMIGMAIFLFVIAGLFVWGLVTYFPTFDPSR